MGANYQASSCRSDRDAIHVRPPVVQGVSRKGRGRGKGAEGASDHAVCTDAKMSGKTLAEILAPEPMGVNKKRMTVKEMQSYIRGLA